MFYGTHFIMSPPAKSKLKRQSQLLSSVLSRTLSYKYRDLDATFSSLGASDDPAELSTQLSAPGVLKVFGDSVCSGTHYKSVLATGTSSARELVKEALERYALSPERAGQYVLCDVVGQAGDAGRPWQAACVRVFGDNEKPLLIQELWKPREGLSRRFELRKRSDVEALAAKDVDTVTAGINAQARRLQRSRAKGTPAPTSGGGRSPPPHRLRRTVSETSLSSATTVPDAARGPEEPGQDAMRCSLYESPHLLLLQGYSQQHDSLVYVLNRERHTVGHRTPSSKPSISLSAPDILPLHCTIRRRQPAGREPAGARLVLEPIPGAPVSVNFSEVGGRTVALRHGDLLSLGLYYLLLFKDPVQAQPLPTQALARLRVVPQSCRLCGAVLRAQGTSSSARAAPPRPRQLHLEFEPDVEDALLQRIMTLVEPGGDDHKLTPAFLLCLCIQHSATRLEPGSFGQLLLKIARMIRETVWEKTKELAEKQAHLQEPLSSASVTMAGLAPDLQHLLFWMSNSVELLYFIQQRCPLYMQSLEEELDVTGSKESLFSCALTASEEAMALLEEVVLYAFQQCVYYVSKSLYVCLPALLECPPFQTECRESWCSAPQLPEELRRVVSVYQAALELLRRLQVHPEIAAQVLAYLFFFSGTLLLNQLLDKGPSLSCFHWPRGVQACARLQQLLEWTRSAGFGEAGERFFRKLSCTLDLLATPSAQLIQMSWASLRAAFPALSPAQLHRLLTQYQLASAMGPMSAWEPTAQDCPEAFRSEKTGRPQAGRFRQKQGSEPVFRLCSPGAGTRPRSPVTYWCASEPGGGAGGEVWAPAFPPSGRPCVLALGVPGGAGRGAGGVGGSRWALEGGEVPWAGHFSRPPPVSTGSRGVRRGTPGSLFLLPRAAGGHAVSPQTRSWSPTRTPRPSFCRARASRWTWTRTAWTTASTSTSSTSATSCGACGASPAPAGGPRRRSAPRAHTMPAPRATPRLPGTPAGEPVRPARSTLRLLQGLPGLRAPQEGHQAV
ncbi:ras-associating and dilute domain-containing protein isoform X3 [Sus scrofa]|uniref:ras-associating and dilute domain-containing protein isoform X3 n=1 Tax=Sus scrofa TaxID=9823 RepID=UPI000A2B30C4|nr:ras-associating and dilute domain-containing protein isoform X3 [Sus scrofa]